MSKHFKMSEFSSPGVPKRSKREPVPAEYQPNVRTTMVQLEVIRKALGGKPLKVISGWRSRAYNRLNKGRASRSKHLDGMAADLKRKGLSPARVYWVISDLIRDGKILPGGLAKYGSFCHYDTRGRYRNGRMARWKPAPKRPRSGLGSK